MTWLIVSDTEARNLARAVTLRVTDAEVGGHFIDADGALLPLESRDQRGVAAATALVATGAWFEYAAGAHVNLDLVVKFSVAGVEGRLFHRLTPADPVARVTGEALARLRQRLGIA